MQRSISNVQEVTVPTCCQPPAVLCGVKGLPPSIGAIASLAGDMLRHSLTLEALAGMVSLLRTAR